MTQQTNTTCAEEYVVKRGDSFYLIAHKLGVPLRDLLAANRDVHPARLMVGDVLCIPREEDDSPGSGGLNGGGTTNGSTTNGSTANGSTSGSTTNGSIDGSTANGSTSGSTTNGSTTNSSTTNGSASDGSTASDSANSSPTPCALSGSCSGVAPDPTLPCPETEQWIVQRGQTVSDLQIRNMVSRHTLEVANPDVDLESLRVGQTLCIPRENVPCELPETYTLNETETLEGVAVRFNLPVASLLRANPCLAPQDFEPGVTVVLPR